jgi:hypothetical protein
LTSDTMWNLTELPERLVVLGGGPTGCELGQAFARLGSDVTIIEATGRLIAREEPRASDALSAALAANGVRVLTSTTVTKAACIAEGTTLSISGPNSTSTLSDDRVLVTAGRRPSTGNLGYAGGRSPPGRPGATSPWTRNCAPATRPSTPPVTSAARCRSPTSPACTAASPPPTHCSYPPAAAHAPEGDGQAGTRPPLVYQVGSLHHVADDTDPTAIIVDCPVRG